MRTLSRLFLCSVLLIVSAACHKRREIETGSDPIIQAPKPSIIDPSEKDKPLNPVSSSDWKPGSPVALQGNWASSLFQDQRCTAFYTFAMDATAELNVICLNPDKKQFEREFRRYSVAEYAGTQQLRFKQTGSSCPPGDTKGIKSEGAAFLYAIEAKAEADQALRMAIWEPVVNRQPLNLSKADGLLVEGFPNKVDSYLGMPIVTGCFAEGIVANFQTSTTP